MKYLILIWCLLSQFAFAQEETGDGPEFLLGDAGVRIELPKPAWKMTRWSDWDFKGTSKDGVLLFAWTTPFQIPIVEGDLEEWSKVFQARAADEGSTEAKVIKSAVGTAHETATAEIELEMVSGAGAALTMYGVSMPVEGQTFHIATVSTASKARASQKYLTTAVEALEIKKPAIELKWGGEVSYEGVTSTLPDTWREPLKQEMLPVAKGAKALGISSLKSCWKAIQPQAGGKAKILLSCQDKLVPGILDTFTQSDVFAEVGRHWFGKNAKAQPEALALSGGGIGVYIQAEIAKNTIHMAGAPNEAGMGKIILLGAAAEDATASEDIKAVTIGSQFSAAPAPELRDTAIYYINYRPSHPFVWLPVVLSGIVLILILAMIVIGARRPPEGDLGDF
jgi:hypothetical protein